MTKKHSKSKAAAEFPALAEKLLEALKKELEKEEPEYWQTAAFIAGFPQQLLSPVLTRAAREKPLETLPLLLELVNHENDSLVLAAAEALGLVNRPESAAALAHLEEELLTQKSVNPELKKAVSRSLHRLRSSGIGAASAAGAGRTAQISAERQFHQAYISNSDGMGTIQAVLTLRSPGGKLETAIVLLNDSEGVIHTRLYTFNQRQFDGFLAEWEPEVFGIRLVPVERDYLNHLVKEHLEINKRNNRRLPSEFVYWQRYFEPPKEDYAMNPVYRQIKPESIQEALAYLLPHTEKLTQTPETRNWLFKPDDIREDAEKLVERRKSRIVLSPAFLSEYKLNLAKEAVGRIFNQEFLPRFIKRAEHLGYIYLLSGQNENARLALAAALDLKGGKEPARNPLLLSLAAKSLEALADLLEKGEKPKNLGLDLSAT